MCNILLRLDLSFSGKSLSFSLSANNLLFHYRPLEIVVRWAKVSIGWVIAASETSCLLMAKVEGIAVASTHNGSFEVALPCSSTIIDTLLNRCQMLFRVMLGIWAAINDRQEECFATGVVRSRFRIR